MAVPVRRRLLSVDEYHQMVGAGILAEEERVELIHGEVFEMTPIGNRHAACLRRLLRLLVPRLGEGVQPDVQNPVSLPAQDSEPQPDLVLLRAREDGYASGHPTAADIPLLVEVSDHSLAYDRDVKVPLYAAAGIPEVWLIDLPAATIVVYRRPAVDGYREVRRFRSGELLSPEALPGAELPVSAILA